MMAAKKPFHAGKSLKIGSLRLKSKPYLGLFSERLKKHRVGAPISFNDRPPSREIRPEKSLWGASTGLNLK